MTERSRPSADQAGALAAQDASEIQALAAAYLQRTDRPGEALVADLFTTDGQLVLGNLTLTTRSAIATFFEDRNRTQQVDARVTRHLSGVLDLVPEGSDRVIGRSSAVVFANNGELPLAAGVPSTICDFDDVFVRVDSGWLIAERRATVVFVGAGAASFAR